MTDPEQHNWHVWAWMEFHTWAQIDKYLMRGHF